LEKSSTKPKTSKKKLTMETVKMKPLSSMITTSITAFHPRSSSTSRGKQKKNLSNKEMDVPDKRKPQQQTPSTAALMVSIPQMGGEPVDLQI
jgi:hypothetical protein